MRPSRPQIIDLRLELLEDSADKAPSAYCTLSLESLQFEGAPSGDSGHEIAAICHFRLGNNVCSSESFCGRSQIRDWYERLGRLKDGTVDECVFTDTDHKWVLSFGRQAGGFAFVGEFAIFGVLRPTVSASNLPKANPRIPFRADHNKDSLLGVRLLIGGARVDADELNKMLRSLGSFLATLGDSAASGNCGQ